ncbi:zf-HC2 domain-containing protein [Actinoplanes sp. NPDC049265]|uniref:zf-HC2 domain-containing protein n=1 Tax=Actinoplanes sp. NPDC049265 TaxID=3363902 RepID=UPI003715DF93
MAELLGLYYLDQLSAAEGALIEGHLPGCAQCRESAAQAIETIASLALLSTRDRAELIDNFGALDRSGPPPGPYERFFPAEPPPAAPEPAASTENNPGPDRTGKTRPEPAVPPSVATAQPATITPVAPPRRLGIRLRAHRDRSGAGNRHRAALVRLSGLLILVLAFGGFATAALLHLRKNSAPVAIPVTTVAVNAADRSTGASLSVFLAQGENGVSVRATVGGLKTGAGYRLEAVTSDGRTLPVTSWVSDGKVRDITAEVPVPLSTLVFFTVSRPGNHPVVSAYLGSATTR